MTTQQEELRRIINLIENAQQPADAEKSELLKSFKTNALAINQVTVATSNQELDEVNWKKGLAGVAAAGALALGASGAHAATLTPEDWGKAGYCMGVQLVVAYKISPEAFKQTVDSAKKQKANAINTSGPEAGKAYSAGSKISMQSLENENVYRLNQEMDTCKQTLQFLAGKANR